MFARGNVAHLFYVVLVVVVLIPLLLLLVAWLAALLLLRPARPTVHDCACVCVSVYTMCVCMTRPAALLRRSRFSLYLACAFSSPSPSPLSLSLTPLQAHALLVEICNIIVRSPFALDAVDIYRQPQQRQQSALLQRSLSFAIMTLPLPLLLTALWHD